MAKLYWRIKKDGKWTWQPAYVIEEDHGINSCLVMKIREEE